MKKFFYFSFFVVSLVAIVPCQAMWRSSHAQQEKVVTPLEILAQGLATLQKQNSELEEVFKQYDDTLSDSTTMKELNTKLSKVSGQSMSQMEDIMFMFPSIIGYVEESGQELFEKEHQSVGELRIAFAKYYSGLIKAFTDEIVAQGAASSK